MSADPAQVDLLRRLAPRVLGALVRRHRRFDACEDAVQEALLAAAVQWPREGLPQSPQAWLITVASRRLADQQRSDHARRRREDAAAAQVPADEAVAPGPEDEQPPAEDDTLTVLILCCHSALLPASQLALTLRAVGGLTTAEIASAFLVPEATMAQRISRAKQRLKDIDGPFAMPQEAERAERMRVVLHVLYLIFNEGYIATSGPDLQRSELTREAIRLTRAVHALLPGDGEVSGLLALMLLTDARRPARTRADGTLIALAEQDRGLWNRAYIEEGTALITDALARASLGPYQLQAAIAAVHDEAASVDSTDWDEVLALYSLLDKVAPSPAASLGRAVAVARVHGLAAGLSVVASVAADPSMERSHRLYAVRAQLREMAGDAAEAAADYRVAATYATNLAEKRYLERRLSALNGREH